MLAVLGETMEAEGEAPLAMGYVQAVGRAKDEALKKLILQACTLSLKASGSTEQCSRLDNRVLAEFTGSVTGFEVVSEEKTRDRVKVRAKAEVSLESVETDTLEAERLYREHGGTLRLSVGIVDRTLGPVEGPTGGKGLVAAKLCDAFAAEGWKPHLLEPLDGSDIAAVQAAAKGDNTDFALVGLLVLSLEPRTAHVGGRLEVIDLQRGVVLAELPIDATGETAQKIVAAQASKWAAALRRDVLGAMRDAQQKGVEVKLTLTGVTGQAQGDALFRKLQKLAGVAEVQGGLEAGTLKLTLRSKVPAKELARTISKSLASSVSITGVTAAAIEGAAK